MEWPLTYHIAQWELNYSLLSSGGDDFQGVGANMEGGGVTNLRKIWNQKSPNHTVNKKF